MFTPSPRATQDIVVTNNASLQKILRERAHINASVRPSGEIVGHIDEVVAAASGRPVFVVITDNRPNAETIAAIKAATPGVHLLALDQQLGAAEIGVEARAFISKIATEPPAETLAGAEKPQDAPEAAQAIDAPSDGASLTDGLPRGEIFGEVAGAGGLKREPMLFTMVQSLEPPCITKIIGRGPDGGIKKQSAAEMTEGGAARIDEVFDIRGFSDWWKTSGPNLGVLVGVSDHDKARIITKAALEAKPKGAVDKDGLPYIARSRDNFRFPVGRGLFAIDCDEKMPIGAFREALGEIAPSLYHAAPSAFRHSASAFIYDTVAGEYVIEEGGIRAFFDVADAQNIAEAGTRLFKWSIIKGHGEAKVSTNGAIRVTSPIDKAIYTPEHFIFTAKADCRDGLEARHTKPQVFNADSPPIVLDKAIPHLTADDEAVFEAEVARLRASVADEAATAREAWVSKRAEVDADHEKVKPQHRPAWVKERREFHARALDGRDLFGSFVVTLDDGKNVTVKEILSNPSVYDGRLCADPLEPDYDGGRAVGRIRLDGKPTISSFARGGDDGSRFWFLHDYDEDKWRRFADAFAKKKERTQNGDDELGVLSGSDTADAADDQSAPPEDAVPEVDDANEAIIAEMVRCRGVLITAKVKIGHLTAEEAQANIAEFEAMARSAVYDRVLDGDFPIKVQLGGNSSREVLVGDIVASPDEFKGKKVRDPYGVASSWIGKLSIIKGAPRVTMFSGSTVFGGNGPIYLIEKPDEGGGRPWNDKPKDDDPVITHSTIADVVVQRHGDDLHYIVAMKAWFIWSGTRWVRDEGNHVFELCHGVAREQAANVELKELIAKLELPSFANGVEELLRKKGAIQVLATAFDSNQWLLGVPSGVIDLRTGEFRQGRREDMVSKTTLVDPDFDADCPLWRKFMNDATGGDAELERFLSQWFGYSLTGDVSEQAFVFFHGDGGNGKGISANTVQNILGDYAGTADMRTFVAAKGDRASNDLADLRGKRFVIASETALGNEWDEARVKNITGGDTITARKLWENNISFDPTFKITILGNHFPNIRGIGHAMRRRMNVVGFNHRPQKPDLKLSEKLKVEYPAILAWLIRGCRDWQANGLQRTQSMIEATEDYFVNQDILGQWMDEWCEVAHGNDEIRDTFANLYKSWTEYARDHGHNNMTGRAFTNTLIERGFKKIKFGGARGYAGIHAVGEIATGKRWVREHMGDGGADVIRPASFDNGGRRDA